MSTAQTLALAALDQPLGLEPLQHLAGRGPRDAEHLGHPGGQGRQLRLRRPILPDREGEEVDRLEVFVDGVALRHCGNIVPWLRWSALT